MEKSLLTLPDILERSVKAARSNPVVVTPEKTVAYAELLASAQNAGRVLARESKSSVVALFFPMSAEFITAYWGTLYAGKEALPLNLLLPPDELKWIVNDSGADLIVAPSELAPKIAPLGTRVLEFPQLLKESPAGELPRPKPDDIATLLYTSGTTGKPKGVMLTHGNLASNADAAVDAMRLESSHRLLACLPSFHTFAITGTILAPIAAAASIAPVGRFDPEGVLKACAATKANTLMMVPSMYRVVTRMQERRPQEIKLKLAISGGEALPQEVRDNFERVFGVPLLEGYGQTESGPIVSFNLPWANKPGTVGKPVRDVEIKIVDPETMKEIPQPGSQAGEIWVKSPSVMKGYHNRAEETARTLTPDGWLRTGDMGELTADGYIRITGRLREMIKVAGEMVFPAEVENALLQHPAVFEAGVAGEKDERKGESVKAFVVLKPGVQATEDQIVQHCRNTLAAYKVPRSIAFRTELPKGPTGKVLRRLLK